MIRWAPLEVAAGQLAAKPFAPREHRRVFWIALWAAAIGAEVATLQPLIEARRDVSGPEVVFGLVGGSFAAFGLVAWRRRPDSHTGRLMTATGFAFFIAPVLGRVDWAVAQTARTLLVDSWVFFFVALLLTLVTSGRLHSRRDRLLIAAYALPLVALQIAWMAVDEAEGGLLVAFPDAGVAHAIDRTQRGLLAVTCAATVAVLVARWWAASQPRRRALLPTLAGALALSLFAALLVNDLIAGERSQPLLWIAACSLVLVPAAFLAGQLRSRLARGGLADLFLGLGALRGGSLRAALARALGDPQLVVATWLPEKQSYADADGRPFALPMPGDGRSLAPIEHDGVPVAALVYDASLDDDPELVEAVRAAAAIAIENEQLHAESHARLGELRASRERIVAAGDAERRRLERNLHDGAQQRLVALSLQLRLIRGKVGDDPSAEQLVTAASDELAHSLAELRELARGIHPAVLEHGLEAALETLAARSAVPTTVAFETSRTLPDAIALAAYFVTSEALANVAKYASATRARVTVRVAGEVATIEIADDGVGGADDSRGSGLRGLADRVEALDGRLSVLSLRGAGTVVTAELSCGA